VVRRFTLCVAFISCLHVLLYSQSKLTATINNYTGSQKRLLAKNIGRFLYVANQGQWDLDSSILFTCRIYGLNRLLPYDELIFNSSLSNEVKLLDNNRADKVVELATKASGEKKIRLLQELAIYYLHMPGNLAGHLDAAKKFITEAKEIAKSRGSAELTRECDALMGEYYSQSGDQANSVAHFKSIVNSLSIGNDKKRQAIACHQLALHLPYNDTARLSNLNKAFSIFQQMKLQEHAIEVLSDIITFYFMTDLRQAKVKINELLLLEKRAGYKHIMDAYYVLNYLNFVTADYMGALTCADSCVAAMTNTGDSTIYSRVCSQMGTLMEHLGEPQRAYDWNMKGIQRRTVEPKIFWYQNLFTIAYSYYSLNKTKEYLSMLQTIPVQYPPDGMIDSMSLARCLASCYSNLNEDDMAERYFRQFINFTERVPPQHLQLFTVYGLQEYAYYCFKKKRYALARSYTNRSLQYPQPNINNLMLAYDLLYRLDSVAGDYRLALFNHKQYQHYQDSFRSISQQFKFQELNVRYATEKKDRDIQVLTQQGLIQQSTLLQTKQTRNMISAGAVLLLIILLLVYNQYRSKQKSERRIEQQKSELERLLNEKEWLLKEVHHRVKNNLQTVVSLLEWQSENLSNDALAAIQASQNRVFATSLLHQKLYQDENVSSVNMSSYMPELIQHLKNAFNADHGIQFKLNIEPVELDVSQAIPVGLITNELITNSIKYAFGEKKTGAEISVSFTLSLAGLAQLLVADNGSGFPALAETAATGLGLKLVRGLAEDLDGKAFIESDNGTIAIVQFKPRKPLESVHDKIPRLIQPK
jgi:two-component system, sensor histidine kinase PdtaS